MSSIETITPYLLRPVTDQEASLGLQIIDSLMRLDTLTDDQGEAALAVAVAAYATHRQALGDRAAVARIANAAHELVARRYFTLKLGEDFRRMVVTEVENGRVET